MAKGATVTEGTGTHSRAGIRLTGRDSIHKIRPTPEGMGQRAVYARSAWIPYQDRD